MREYALITRNMIKYTSIYLSAEYARILNISDGRFVELGNFDKHFFKNTRERGPSRKHFGVFSPRYF